VKNGDRSSIVGSAFFAGYPSSPGGPVSIGVTLNAIYLSNFLAHFLAATLMTPNEALRLIRRHHRRLFFLERGFHRFLGSLGFLQVFEWSVQWGNYREYRENAGLNVRKCL